MRKRHLGIGAKIWCLVGLLVVALGMMTAQSLVLMRDTLAEDRRALLKTEVETALSVVAAIHARAVAGEMSMDAAKAAALDTLRSMRYGDNEFFVVTNGECITQLHPARPELVGKDMSQAADVNGVHFVRELVNTARKDGGGYVSYVFAKAKDQPPAPKVAYVQMFKPFDWAILTGVFTDDLDRQFRERALTEGVDILLILVVAVAVAVWVNRSITRPLGGIMVRMAALADGDTGSAIAGTDRTDEIGSLARAMEVFRENAIERRRAEEREKAENARREQRARAIQELAASFDRTVSEMLETVANAGVELEATASSMAAGAEQTTRQATTVTSATQRASDAVETAASAAEELSASIREIGRQVTEASDVASSAAEDAADTNRIVRDLADTASKIGEVIDLINDIAGQTNLLALNATIEAARAGETGKGFAVVAGEVKNLANQTTRATEEIGRQISTVQAQTQGVVAAIGAIVARIQEIDHISTAIASSVEEQSAATAEIAGNVAQACEGTTQVVRTIGGVSEAAAHTGAASQQVLGSARALSSQAERLRGAVTAFLNDVRTA